MGVERIPLDSHEKDHLLLLETAFSFSSYSVYSDPTEHFAQTLFRLQMYTWAQGGKKLVVRARASEVNFQITR